MYTETIKNKLGPCGLSCDKCFAFKDGEIKKHSLELKKHLGNFDSYAQRFLELLDEPSFKNYPAFSEMLNYFTSVECKGCRKESCKLYKNCRVRECSKEKQVDFCFQCSEFPCQQTGFDEHLHKRSVTINLNMKEIGVGNYYKEIKKMPRY